MCSSSLHKLHQGPKPKVAFLRQTRNRSRRFQLHSAAPMVQMSSGNLSHGSCRCMAPLLWRLLIGRRVSRRRPTRSTIPDTASMQRKVSQSDRNEVVAEFLRRSCAEWQQRGDPTSCSPAAHNHTLMRACTPSRILRVSRKGCAGANYMHHFNAVLRTEVVELFAPLSPIPHK